MSELQIITIRLRREDVETLKKFYSQKGGYQRVVRQIAHRHARRLREIEAQEITPQITAGDPDE